MKDFHLLLLLHASAFTHIVPSRFSFTNPCQASWPDAPVAHAPPRRTGTAHGTAAAAPAGGDFGLACGLCRFSKFTDARPKGVARRTSLSHVSASRPRCYHANGKTPDTSSPDPTPTGRVHLPPWPMPPRIPDPTNDHGQRPCSLTLRHFQCHEQLWMPCAPRGLSPRHCRHMAPSGQCAAACPQGRLRLVRDCGHAGASNELRRPGCQPAITRAAPPRGYAGDAAA